MRLAVQQGTRLLRNRVFGDRIDAAFNHLVGEEVEVTHVQESGSGSVAVKVTKGIAHQVGWEFGISAGKVTDEYFSVVID